MEPSEQMTEATTEVTIHQQMAMMMEVMTPQPTEMTTSEEMRAVLNQNTFLPSNVMTVSSITFHSTC